MQQLCILATFRVRPSEEAKVNVLIAAVSAPMHMNGVSRHAASLATALLQTESISKVHFVAGDWQREMFREIIEKSDARLHTHFVNPRFGNLGRLSWYYRELPHVEEQLEVDVVHLAYPAPIRSGAFRCAYVVSLHDLYPFDIPENFGMVRSVIARAIMRQCIERVDGIACVSESTRSGLETWFPEAAPKAVIVHNVVEPGRLHPMSRSALLPGERPFLLCVAQHRRNKNVPLAIRVFERVLRERIIPYNARLLVVGIQGPETGEIQETIRELKLERNVLLLSGLSEAELQRCYRQCRLLIAPSTIEGFGLPVAEALQSGCPVVCSDIPAFREVGGEACRYVAWGDGVVKRYVQAVSEVLNSPRPSPIHLPHLSSRMIGQKYANWYHRLTCSSVSEFWYATATRT